MAFHLFENSSLYNLVVGFIVWRINGYGADGELWGLVSALMMNRKLNWVSFSHFSLSHDIGK